MPPLTQAQLHEELNEFFSFLNFPCPDMPRLSSRYCFEKVPGIVFTEPSLTKQAFAAEADINNIVNRYNATGILPAGERELQYGDFSSGMDYAECLVAIQEANDDFQSIPSQIRNQFDNDPQKFLDFIHDEDNRDEAIAMGLLPATEPDPIKSKTEPVQGDDPAPEPKEPEAK